MSDWRLWMFWMCGYAFGIASAMAMIGQYLLALIGLVASSILYILHQSQP